MYAFYDDALFRCFPPEREIHDFPLRRPVKLGTEDEKNDRKKERERETVCTLDEE